MPDDAWWTSAIATAVRNTLESPSPQGARREYSEPRPPLRRLGTKPKSRSIQSSSIGHFSGLRALHPRRQRARRQAFCNDRPAEQRLSRISWVRIPNLRVRTIMTFNGCRIATDRGHSRHRAAVSHRAGRLQKRQQVQWAPTKSCLGLNPARWQRYFSSSRETGTPLRRTADGAVVTPIAAIGIWRHAAPALIQTPERATL